MSVYKIDSASPKYKRIVQLSWQILEHKYRYYELCRPTISDYEYDMLEQEYDGLCKELGIPPTAADMVGFDTSRWCCRAVMKKMGDKRWNREQKKRRTKRR